jgi:plastocyanin
MRRSIVFAALAIVAASFSPAGADGTPIIASEGNRNADTFTTPVVITPVGGPITFLNADVQPHGVSADAFGPDTNAWCDFFDPGACPLFWAPITDAGVRTSLVQGLSGLVSGQQYAFHCTLHDNMHGLLIAV